MFCFLFKVKLLMNLIIKEKALIKPASKISASAKNAEPFRARCHSTCKYIIGYLPRMRQEKNDF